MTPCGFRVHSNHLDLRWYFRSDIKSFLPPSGRSRMSQGKRSPAAAWGFQAASRASLGSRFQKPSESDLSLSLSLSPLSHRRGWGWVGKALVGQRPGTQRVGQGKGRPFNSEPEPHSLAVLVEKLIQKQTKPQQTIQEPRSSGHLKAKLQEAVNPWVDPRPKPYWSHKAKVLLTNVAQRGARWR